MRISQMRYFQAACKYATLHRASKELHVSQPSISVAIRDLETEFGVQLFYRVGNRLTLTSAGEFFYSRINDILDDITLLESQMVNDWRISNGVRINMLPITGSGLLVPEIKEFQAFNNSIKISLKESSANQAIRELAIGECDIALIIMEQLDVGNLDGVILKKTEFAFVTDQSNRGKFQPSIRISDLDGSSLILLQDDSYVTKEIKKRFNQQGIVPNVLLYALHLPLIQNLLSIGDSGTFLPKELAQRMDNVVCIPLEDPLQVTYALVWKQKEHYPPDVAKFIQYFNKKGTSIHDFRKISIE